MPALSFFAWLEETAISVWIRETPEVYAFPFILYLHTLGLAMVAGLSSAVALGIVHRPQLRLSTTLRKLFPWIWLGFGINVLSGVALLVAYPAKALTNPVFYIKLVAIAAAVGIVQWLERQFVVGDLAAGVTGTGGAGGASGAVIADAPALKRAAWALIGLWLIATTTGRFLAYTHSTLLAGFEEFY